MAKLTIKKSIGTKSIVSAPQNNLYFTTLTQDELREAQHSGRIPTKEHYFATSPRITADDARLGLFGKKEIPRANKPVFVVAIKMPNSSGMRPVPHGTPMFTKNTPIPFSDIKEIHEVRINTDSGFHQFRRMGGINKSWGFEPPKAAKPTKALGPQKPLTSYSATPPEHMDAGDFSNSEQAMYHSGVSGPHDSERVMSLHAPTRQDASLHQQNASWSQRFSSPQSLEYNKDVIRKFLDGGTHHIYKTDGTNGYPNSNNPPITNSADFDAEFPMMMDDLKYTNKQQPYIKDPEIWKHDIFPYLKKNGDSEFDKALLEHGQTNIAHQETYGKNYGDTAGNTKFTERGQVNDSDNKELRPDHSMWHFADRSPALKKYLLENGFTGAHIPNFLSSSHPYHGENTLALMANQHAVSDKRDASGVHQLLKEKANPWDGQIPPAPQATENPYDAPVSPIEHHIQPIEQVHETVQNRLSTHGIESQITPTGFLSVSTSNPKITEPHVMWDVSKGSVASAFGVDPRIFNRTTLKMPNYQPRSAHDTAQGWQMTEGITVRGKNVSAAKNPERVPHAYHIMVHEMIHSLQQEAAGATSNENNKRYRSFSFGKRGVDEEMRGKVEGHTELMTTVLTGALLGGDRDHLEDTPYQRYVYGLANQLRASTKGNPAQALAQLKEQTMYPMKQANIKEHVDEDTAESRIQRAGAEQFIEKMIAVARGETPKSSSPVAEAAKRKDNLWVQRTIARQEKAKR